MVKKASSNRGSVRIIAGRWRGRRLQLAAGDAARPTPDRVRETLFNWLMPVLPGARCLDLFAGSGVLGIEAISRGAASAVLVEHDQRVLAALDDNLDRLDLDAAEVLSADAWRYLESRATPFNIVFLDPPYAEKGLGDLCTLLERGWLAPGARIYLEWRRSSEPPALPASWQLLRDKTAGQVRFALAQRD
jgi:16S rRNA (guanine966-N2)-methyltransferase